MIKETRQQRIARIMAGKPKHNGIVRTTGVPTRLLPGDALKQIIKDRYGIPPCGACHVTAAKMNAHGVQWCRDNIETLAEELHHNAQQRVWTAVLDFAQRAVYGNAKYIELIRDACDMCNVIARDDSKSIMIGTVFPPIETRHLLCHIMPDSTNRVWEKTAASILRRIDLFNGRRVIAVATGSATDSCMAVADMFAGHDVTVIPCKNESSLREVVSLHNLLSHVETLSETEATFYCHSKGVTRGHKDAVHQWRDVMFYSCLEWELVQGDLKTHALTGPFKKIGHGFPGSESDWHYSGTFYWFRNAELFRRQWQVAEKEWWGAEAYPSLLFHPREAGCLIHEGSVSEMNLYSHKYWNDVIIPLLQKHGHIST